MKSSIRTAVAGLAVIGLVACGSSESGTASTAVSAAATSAGAATATAPSPTSSSASSSTTSSSSSSSGTGGEIDPVAAELVTKMIAGYANVTSVKGTMTIDGGGMSGNQPLATFDQVIGDGAVTAMRMKMTIPNAGDFELIVVDDRMILGGALASNYGNQYVEISETTTDPTLSQLYTSFADALNSASVTQYLTFLKLATNTKSEGAESINGVETEKYTMVLDLTRLDTADVDPSTAAAMETLVKNGVTELPCTFWIDADGNLIQVEQKVEVGGEAVDTSVAFSDYNAPLEIVAPDPALVAVAP